MNLLPLQDRLFQLLHLLLFTLCLLPSCVFCQSSTTSQYETPQTSEVTTKNGTLHDGKEEAPFKYVNTIMEVVVGIMILGFAVHVFVRLWRDRKSGRRRRDVGMPMAYAGAAYMYDQSTKQQPQQPGTTYGPGMTTAPGTTYGPNQPAADPFSQNQSSGLGQSAMSPIERLLGRPRRAASPHTTAFPAAGPQGQYDTSNTLSPTFPPPNPSTSPAQFSSVYSPSATPAPSSTYAATGRY